MSFKKFERLGPTALLYCVTVPGQMTKK